MPCALDQLWTNGEARWAMVGFFFSFCLCAENNVWASASQVRLQLLDQHVSSRMPGYRLVLMPRGPQQSCTPSDFWSPISNPRGEVRLQLSLSAASLSLTAVQSFSACHTGRTLHTVKLTKYESFPHCRFLLASGSEFGMESSPRALTELSYTFSMVEGGISNTGKTEKKHEMKYCGLTHPQPSESAPKIISI